ncbi:hypothetical protein PZT57_26705 [Pseudomonas aeruginosa]|uniref:hypothetical protein n=1 Tax=Pseudomonas aeruginosa TaxID=287 RepID=UPI002B273934|nr:hypothetical protein [Pseudomonas aeruginosa]MEA8592241.1 hypothetical protein [Pseudomonas aeruginosa]
MPHTYTFDSTGDAYDATQCDDDVLDGHALLVLEEGVVGLSWTWPVAVTIASGELHEMGEAPAKVIADAGWTTPQIQHAVALADKHNFPVADWARKAASESAEPQQA